MAEFARIANGRERDPRSGLRDRRSALGARRPAGLWALGAGLWALGSRRSALGARRWALGARRSALGSRIPDPATGSRRPDPGARIPDPGSRTPDPGPRLGITVAFCQAVGQLKRQPGPPLRPSAGATHPVLDAYQKAAGSALSSLPCHVRISRATRPHGRKWEPRFHSARAVRFHLVVGDHHRQRGCALDPLGSPR
jgi:hypothetical protein